MKNTVYLFCLLFCSSILLTSCFDDFDEGLYDIIGPVATIPVLQVSDGTPAPGNDVNITYRYYSENIEVRNVNLTANYNGESVTIVNQDISNFNKEDSYQETQAFTVPEDLDLGTEIVFLLEITTVNDLQNSRTVSATVTEDDGE